MKSYNEMAADVLHRIYEYEAEQKHRRKAITRTAVPFCCAGLAAVVGFGIWQGSRQSAPPVLTAESQDIPYSADTSEISSVPAESEAEPAENNSEPAVSDKIVVHQIDGISLDKHNICLLGDDFVQMDKPALNEYYGTNVFPNVPKELSEWTDVRYGIYKRDGGTGEVYWDGIVINYSNEDFSRSVNVEVKKGSLPLCDYYLFDPAEEKSVINGVEVAIGQSAEYYLARFMFRDVGFQLVGEGLSQDEFVDVIASLITA